MSVTKAPTVQQNKGDTNGKLKTCSFYPNIYEIEGSGGNASHAFEQNPQTLSPPWYSLPWGNPQIEGNEEENCQD